MIESYPSLSEVDSGKGSGPLKPVAYEMADQLRRAIQVTPGPSRCRHEDEDYCPVRIHIFIIEHKTTDV
jgi:hypothetical protein